MKTLSRFLPAIVAASLLSGCEVGPDYVAPPPAPVPAHYKDLGNWKPAHPQDSILKGRWWEIYHDRQLNALEEKVDIGNQNVLQAEANFLQAAAAVKVEQASLFPTVTADPAITYSQTQPLFHSNSSNSSGGTGVATGTGGAGGTAVVGGGSGSGRSISPTGVYNVPLQVTYLVDVWGQVRRAVENSAANAQALFAALENARLSYQGTLAQDYFTLRGLDAEAKLLNETTVSYQKYLVLTQNRYNSGIASRGDVAAAQTQLDQTRAQLIDLGVTRAQYSDAIATLIGVPASNFSLGDAPLDSEPPRVPAGVPSTLLERRPDIAEAERNMAAANAEIGVEVAGYYPQLTLSGSAGLDEIALGQVFSGPNFLWSAGPAVAQTIFDAGRTHGLVQEATATFTGTVAAYRQTVLTAFQQIEDALAGLRLLESEGAVQDSAVTGAQKSLDVTTNLYKQGINDYLTVITAQAILLNDQITAVNIRTRRMTTSVMLVEALGGGWNRGKLATRGDVADVPQAQRTIDRAKQPPPPSMMEPAAQLRH